VRQLRYSQREVLSFTAASLRPPNSRDLNPIDYKVTLGTIQDRVYWAKLRHIDDLK